MHEKYVQCTRDLLERLVLTVKALACEFEAGLQF